MFNLFNIVNILIHKHPKRKTMETKTTSKSQVISTDLHCVNTQKINSKFKLTPKPILMKKNIRILMMLFILIGYKGFAQIITTVAGTGGVCGYSGDGGQATVALLGKPTSV